VIGLTGSPGHGLTLVIDIGGGSTEFINYEGQVRGIQTTPLGVVRLTETYLHHDPPHPPEMAQLCAAIDKQLHRVQKALSLITHHSVPGGRGRDDRFVPSGPVPGAPRTAAEGASLITHFIGTAGTVTTLAALKKRMRRYDPRHITGTRLSRRDLEGLMQRLISVPSKSRLKFPGMEKGREDLILAGIAILLRCMERFALPALTVCDSGILEGIALSQAPNRMERNEQRE
jgi:exopolyphosphatase/guanosine-5'-triphosphate,3'-diphosphate pyrophosphatase